MGTRMRPANSIVVTPMGVRLCRPSEAVLDILPPAARPVLEGGRRARHRRAQAGGSRSRDTADLSRRVAAEALGTGLLVATVVGSGIMAEKLAGGNVAIALLGNTIPTGAILVVLILALGPISGAHFNPAVSLVMAINGGISVARGRPYVVAQVVGGCLGTLAAHGMFDLPLLQLATKARTGPAQWFAEFVATFGLLMTILAVVRYRIEAVPYAVGLYITAAYWFTASTSFANPAVTLARASHRHLRRHRARERPDVHGRRSSSARSPAWRSMAGCCGPKEFRRYLEITLDALHSAQPCYFHETRTSSQAARSARQPDAAQGLPHAGAGRGGGLAGRAPADEASRSRLDALAPPAPADPDRAGDAGAPGDDADLPGQLPGDARSPGLPDRGVLRRVDVLGPNSEEAA